MEIPGYFLPLVLSVVGIALLLGVAILYICAKELDRREERKHADEKEDLYEKDPPETGLSNRDYLRKNVSDARAHHIQMDSANRPLSTETFKHTEEEDEHATHSDDDDKVRGQVNYLQELHGRDSPKSMRSITSVHSNVVPFVAQPMAEMKADTSQKEAPPSQITSSTRRSLAATNITFKLVHNQVSATLVCQIVSIRNLLLRKYGGPAKIRFETLLLANVKRGGKAMKMKSKFLPLDAVSYPPFQFSGMISRQELAFYSLSIKLVGRTPVENSRSKKKSIGSVVVSLDGAEFNETGEVHFTRNVLPKTNDL